ncbi:RNA polymerase sigma factor [Rhodohalobacter sp. 614A]|uniref:RNA polymerase sigma factor n=1 Tax=Rhodohalobacter sp. 614A TaxID=2908649 RepID=UPI001F437050|nr:sigma-70 family RNA polymerase sigma factor [Rhodohalobacter sp. 614A]
MFLQADHSLDGSQENDTKLWKAYLEGDQKALGRIFLQHYKSLYQYGLNLSLDDGVVEDGIQELFLKLWKKRKRINEADSVEYYLLYSLRRILLRHKEQSESIHRRNREYMEDISLSLQSAEDRIIYGEIERKRYQLFLKAQENLTDRQKEIFYLRMSHGMTNAEIAEFLDLSIQRVKNCMYESVKIIRESIARASVNK